MFGLHGLGFLPWFIPLIQILCIVHVIKNGRNWYWVWIIFFFSIIGAAVYFFVEILPGFPDLSFTTLLNAVLPGFELRNLQKAVEDTDTVQNRKALADYYLAHGEPEKALTLLRECVKGVFKEDGELNIRLCTALVDTGQFQEARGILEGLRKRNAAFETAQRDVLYGRVLEEQGRTKDAIRVYEEVMGKFGSEVEGCCRLAKLYVQSGEKEKAKTLYQDLLKRAKHFSPHYRALMAGWIKAAKAGQKEIE